LDYSGQRSKNIKEFCASKTTSGKLSKNQAIMAKSWLPKVKVAGGS